MPAEDHARRFSKTRVEVRMPIVWMTISTATVPEVEQFRDDPEGLRARIRDVVAAVQVERGRPRAELRELYFEVDRPVAHAFVENLDDFSDMKAIGRYFGAEDMVKLIRVEQAVEAVQRERGIRDRLVPNSGPAAT